MREFSENIKSLLMSSTVSYIFLVKIVTPKTTIYETNASANVSVNLPGEALKVFNSNAGLASVDSPRMSNIVDREAYKITYIDPLFSKQALFESGLTGAAISVFVCFYNTLGVHQSGVAPGGLFNASEDLFMIYEGFVDTQSYAVDPDSGTVVAVIEAAGPMASLGQSRPFYTSAENMSHLNNSDTSFDQIYTGSEKVALLWGRYITPNA